MEIFIVTKTRNCYTLLGLSFLLVFILNKHTKKYESFKILKV